MSSGYHYVYVLQSEKDRSAFYSGYTTELGARLKKHNEGGSEHTAGLRPRRLRVALAFPDKYRALEFERCLKSHSGRAFMTKHF